MLNTEDKKLSIVVPVYNVEGYLEECVDSLLAQTYENIEIILVDDGSTDNSPALCDTLANSHENVRVVHKKNGGLPSARNAGIKEAKGYYIGFIDSDDVIHSNMYQELIHLLEKNNAQMAICNFETFNKKGTIAKSYRYSDEILSYEENPATFYECALDSSCNRVYIREDIEKSAVLFQDKSIVAQEDYWFLVRYFSHISKIVCTKKVFYRYRQRGSSITKSRSDNDITSRSINFISLAEEYTATCGRKSKEFLESMTLNMFFSSVNNLNFPTIKKIKFIVRKFSDVAYLKSAIRNVSIKSEGLRARYDALLRFFLKHRLLTIFAIFESIRVKRLVSNKNTEDYYS